MWADINAAITDLRTLLSDGANDKIVYQKKCFGRLDSSNKAFKTFEYRRLTDFTTSTGSFGVYKNGTILSSGAIASDDPISGHFTLVTAPVDGDVIEATYYYHWFLDSELTQFITNAVQWLGNGTNPASVPDGLIPAALHYGAQESYHKLAIRWSIRMSEVYLLEDAPDPKNMGIADTYRKIAEDFTKKANVLRDDFYKRQGRPLSPLFGTSKGRVTDYVPRR